MAQEVATTRDHGPTVFYFGKETFGCRQNLEDVFGG